MKGYWIYESRASLASNSQQPAHLCLRKPFAPKVERKMCIELLAASKLHLASMIGVLTEHCLIGTRGGSRNLRTEVNYLFKYGRIMFSLF